VNRRLLVAPGAGIIALLVAAPMTVLFVYSLWRTSTFEILHDWNLDNYGRSFSKYLSLVLRTVGLGAVVGVITTALALPLAYAIRFKFKRGQDAMMFLILLALFGGYLVRIYAWRAILGDSGVINSALTSLGLIDKPLGVLLFSRFAVIVTLVNFLLPLATLPLYAALQELPRERIDASHDLGAGRLATTRRLVLPELAFPLFVSFAICTVLAAGDWVTPTLVGGTNSTMIGQVVYQQFGTSFNWPLGAAMSFTTAMVILVLLGIAAFGARFARTMRMGKT
jgi:spermidine/putrescine transport system permease protein